MQSESQQENAFSPKMEMTKELELIQQARISIGGAGLRPIEIDMDILADAYPQEGHFLKSENVSHISNVNDVSWTPSKALSVSLSESGTPRALSGRKTPNRRFFKTETEREYARNLMKELVQLYIVEGVHGKDAFRRALLETKRRVHLRRGEEVPSPPVVTSPIFTSPYPKISPPGAKSPASEKRAAVSMNRELPIAATPSRVHSLVAAIQASPKRVPISSSKKVAMAKVAVMAASIASLESPVSSKKIVAEKAVDEDCTPKKRNIEESAKEVDELPAQRSSARIKKHNAEHDPSPIADHASPSRRAIVEHASPSRKKASVSAEKKADSPPTVTRPPRRAAAMAAIEALEEPPPRSVRKKAAAEETSDVEGSSSSSKRTRTKPATTPVTSSKRKKPVQVPLDTIPEDQPIVVPIRPSRKAKIAAAAVIKK